MTADKRKTSKAPKKTSQPKANSVTPDRPYDIVIFGATGFTGKLTAKYLATCNEADTLRWAIAGRSPSKLESVKQTLSSLNPKSKDIGLINAEITDTRSLKEMAEQAKVVISTVGPYLNYGEQVVKACVEAGTHYVDLTGEPEFVDAMIHYYHEVAEKKHVKIVNSCGFDSIPHDLGALFAVNALNDLLGPERAGNTPITVEGFVTAGGTFSGGTWHSAITQFSRVREYERKRRAWRKDQPKSLSRRKIAGVTPKLKFRREFGAWACPFPTIDPQVVKRSARARENYGPNFKYGHYLLVQQLPKLAMGAIGIGGVVALSQFKKTRSWLLNVKDPGQGPTQSQMDNGWFKVRMIAEAEGLHAWAEISGGDPGYGETAKMLAESALCLALDTQKIPAQFGVVTPAVAMGEPLIERLQNAGIQFNLLS